MRSKLLLNFKGFGCNVIGYDIAPVSKSANVTSVALDKLLSESDIISLHIPLTKESRNLINEDTINQMKPGVMLINTSRGSVVSTADALAALDSGQIGYLGLDVYENERDLLLPDSKPNGSFDPSMRELTQHPNVIVTPHQAYLTVEALNQIALRTIQNLDEWQKGSARGKVCA